VADNNMYPRTARSGVISQTNRTIKGSRSSVISDDKLQACCAPGNSWRADRSTRPSRLVSDRRAVRTIGRTLQTQAMDAQLGSRCWTRLCTRLIIAFNIARQAVIAILGVHTIHVYSRYLSRSRGASGLQYAARTASKVDVRSLHVLCV